MEADKQIGRLIKELQKLGKWEDTLFILTSDHGQTKTGWHPTLPEEAGYSRRYSMGRELNGTTV